MKRIVLCVATVLALLSCGGQKGGSELEAGFLNPPHESRPMVLWHWMYGNISKDGIKKDLQWMHDIGLSGFFLFDAAYSTPQVVDTLLPYMSSAKTSWEFYSPDDPLPVSGLLGPVRILDE